MKVPTKHGLDRKFKSWRRGKSEKSNKRSSLKQQLRGVERLLSKVPEEETTRREEMKSKILTMKEEIDGRQKVLQEKKNAENSHGQRFLDRQRLTRQEKQVRKSKNSDEKKEEQLFQTVLDQVYVAYHPNDVKYMPLFRKGQRVVDTSRHLYRRAVTRRRILKQLASSADNRSFSWVAADQYAKLPKEWSIQDEERIFGGSISRSAKQDLKSSKKSEDSRFSLAAEHDVLLQAANDVDAQLDQQKEEKVEEVGESSDNSDASEERNRQPEIPRDKQQPDAKNDVESDSSESSDDDDEEEADPLTQTARKENTDVTSIQGSKTEPKEQTDKDASSESDDSSSDSSSDDDEDAKQLNKPAKADSDSENSSDSSSDSSDDEVKKNDATAVDTRMEPTPVQEEKEEVDDFLMDANEDGENVFSMTLNQVPAMNDGRGDKSKGWNTQNQRPGEFKKKRVRR